MPIIDLRARWVWPSDPSSTGLPAMSSVAANMSDSMDAIPAPAAYLDLDAASSILPAILRHASMSSRSAGPTSETNISLNSATPSAAPAAPARLLPLPRATWPACRSCLATCTAREAFVSHMSGSARRSGDIWTDAPRPPAALADPNRPPSSGMPPTVFGIAAADIPSAHSLHVSRGLCLQRDRGIVPASLRRAPSSCPLTRPSAPPRAHTLIPERPAPGGPRLPGGPAAASLVL